MVIWCGVEVQLHVRDGDPDVVRVEHVLEVADPHVVGLERQVPPPEVMPRDLQVARAGRQGFPRVEAVVGSRPLALETRDARALAMRRRDVDLPGQPAAAREVDVHPEQRLAGRGEDLGEPGGVDRVAARDHVGAAGALDEHERLEHVRVYARAGDRGVDRRPERRHAGRRGEGAARALDEQDVIVALDRPGHEVRLAARDVRKRVARLRRLADSRQWQRRGAAVAAAGSDQDRRDDQRDEYPARYGETSEPRRPAPGSHGLMSRGRRAPSSCTPPRARDRQGSGRPSSPRRRSGRC